MLCKRIMKLTGIIGRRHQMLSSRKYSKEHEWLIIDEDTQEAQIGISSFAKNQLGDIVYIDFPEQNTEFEAGESAGQMESVKTVGEIIMPLNATILEVNPEVQEDTSILNDNSETTWLLKVKLAAGYQLSNLLSEDQYNEYCKQQ